MGDFADRFHVNHVHNDNGLSLKAAIRLEAALIENGVSARIVSPALRSSGNASHDRRRAAKNYWVVS